MNDSVIASGRWNAESYFRNLTDKNRLARKFGFRFCVVSDLQGFQDAVNAMQDAQAFVCVSDVSDGMMSLLNTPHIRQVKTVFLAMRHSVQSSDWTELRTRSLDIMREIFRQFMSVFAKERTFIEQGGLFVNPDISFCEINRYFLSGCACAYFQISTTAYADLIYREDEWCE